MLIYFVIQYNRCGIFDFNIPVERSCSSLCNRVYYMRWCKKWSNKSSWPCDRVVTHWVIQSFQTWCNNNEIFNKFSHVYKTASLHLPGWYITPLDVMQSKLYFEKVDWYDVTPVSGRMMVELNCCWRHLCQHYIDVTVQC